MILWLTGPPLSGKSTLGQMLAGRYNCAFTDTDVYIEHQYGASPAELIRSKGEKAFREIESESLSALCHKYASAKLAVIAVGGGAVENPVNRDLMRSAGLRLCLRINQDTARQRMALSATDRPLSPDITAWKRLLSQRTVWYNDAEAILESDDPPDLSLRRIERAVREHSSDPAWVISYELRGNETQVYYMNDVYALMQTLGKSESEYPLRCVVADANVAQMYPSTLKQLAGPAGLVLIAQPGEEHKTFRVIEQFVERCAAHGLTRSGMIVGIGGGVTTDLAGFLGSVYMRGIRTVYVPTTLLGMVDAAIGGKTAVNVGGVRNLAGTFHQPARVYICPAFLHTLPQRELKAGFTESLKMGIANMLLLRKEMESATARVWEGRIPENIGRIIQLSVAAKADVVEEDEFDTGKRHSLNLGHTFAHALETVEPGRHTHGEAVAFGLIASAELAHALGKISVTRLRWICQHALRMVRHSVADHDYDRLIAAMKSDKKRVSDNIRLVLPLEEVGVEIVDVHDVSLVVQAMTRAFKRIRIMP